MQFDLFNPPPDQPIALAYGMGVNSTGELARMAKLKWRPHLLLFADTGGEKRETYDFEPIIQDFLKREGFPPVITVKYKVSSYERRFGGLDSNGRKLNWPPYYNLEQNCLTNGTLPGISMGPASCSVKWKQQPQHEFISNWQPAKDIWSAGGRVIKLIGFDAGPRDRARTYASNPKDSHLYDYRTPLIEWNMDREACVREIQSVGLPVPPKSSCFFCLAMKPWEVDQLPIDKLRRTVRMEARAHPRLKTCEGLWRSTVKGHRGATPRPGSMTDYIRQKKLLPEDEIQSIWDTTFEQIITFQEGYAQAKSDGKESEFLAAHANEDYRGEVLTTV